MVHINRERAVDTVGENDADRHEGRHLQWAGVSGNTEGTGLRITRRHGDLRPLAGFGPRERDVVGDPRVTVGRRIIHLQFVRPAISAQSYLKHAGLRGYVRGDKAPDRREATSVGLNVAGEHENSIDEGRAAL